MRHELSNEIGLFFTDARTVIVQQHSDGIRIDTELIQNLRTLKYNESTVRRILADIEAII